jgi:hypothetical protein
MAQPGPGKVDAVARIAETFADQLADVTGVAAGEQDESDAASVNANIAMVAKEADDLITALIEARMTRFWMKRAWRRIRS